MMRRLRTEQQFVAVSFFLAQLAHAHISSATVLVNCGAIGKII